MTAMIAMTANLLLLTRVCLIIAWYIDNSQKYSASDSTLNYACCADKRQQKEKKEIKGIN